LNNKQTKEAKELINVVIGKENNGILLKYEFWYHWGIIYNFNDIYLWEDKLDEVSSGKETDWAKICKTCYKEIGELAKPMKTLEKQVFPIDETHDFVFEKFGPVVRTRTEEGTFEYKPVKKTMKIDLEKLKNQEYTLDELYEIKNDCLGEYEGEPMFIKNGKFGPYVEWGTKRESIKKIFLNIILKRKHKNHFFIYNCK
jgi:hypothetical protein